MKSLLTLALLVGALASPALANSCKVVDLVPGDIPKLGKTALRFTIRIKKIAALTTGGSRSYFIDVTPDFVANYTITVDGELFGSLPPDSTLEFLKHECGDDIVSKIQAFNSAATFSASGHASQPSFSADLNGDGALDSLTIGPSAVVVTIRNPDGTALSTARYTVGPNASSGLAADFNGDGKLDLAITNEGRTPNFGGATSGTVSILLGNGDGTLQPAVSYPVEGQPDSLAVADFDGDGKLDIAAAGYSLSPDAVSVMLGAGDGTFRRPSTFNVGSGPYSIVAADFNNDGYADLATANLGSRDVSVLLGKGNGTFEPAVNTASGTQKGYLGYVDLNHDGNLDLVIADYSSNSLVPMLGNGNGTFQAPIRYLAGAQPASLGIIPLGDGNTALLTVDDITGDVIEAFASPDGTLSTPVLTLVGQDPSAIAAGDLNGDGKPDLLITDRSSGSAYVLLNGTDAFAAPAAYPVAALGAALADLNNDGVLDVVVVNQGIGALLGAGDGSLRAVQNFAAGSRPAALALADFNRDGKVDVAVANLGSDPVTSANPGAVSVLLGKGDGTFPAPTQAGAFPGLRAFTIAAGDFNGDGNPDLAVGISNPVNNTGSVAILLGKGDGTFQAPVNYPIGPPATQLNFLTVGDFNGDSKVDLALLTTDVNFVNKVATLLGNGDGTFAPGGAAATGFGPQFAVVVDLDGDGKADLVVAHCCGDTDATYLLGNGDGTLQDEVHFLSGPSPVGIAITDFDGDGKPDLAIAGQVGLGKVGTVATMLNRLTVPAPPAADDSRKVQVSAPRR